MNHSTNKQIARHRDARLRRNDTSHLNYYFIGFCQNLTHFFLRSGHFRSNKSQSVLTNYLMVAQSRLLEGPTNHQETWALSAKIGHHCTPGQANENGRRHRHGNRIESPGIPDRTLERTDNSKSSSARHNLVWHLNMK